MSRRAPVTARGLRRVLHLRYIFPVSDTRKRWIPVAVFTAALVVVYVGAAFLMTRNDSTTDSGDAKVGYAMLGVIAAISIAAGVWWGRRSTMQTLVSQAGLAVVLAGVLSVVLGPLAAGTNPFGNGPGDFLVALLTFWGVTAGGVLVGLLVLMLFGADHRSRQLARTERYYSRGKPLKGGAAKTRAVKKDTAVKKK